MWTDTTDFPCSNDAGVQAAMAAPTSTAVPCSTGTEQLVSLWEDDTRASIAEGKVVMAIFD